jgi:large subunit ribosomal protein L21
MADYAIVESGGQQFRVEKGTELVVDRVPEDEGAKVLLRPVAFMGGDKLVASGDDLEKVKVEAKVAQHFRGEKLTVFKYKAKKGYRRRAGHRQEQTRLEVTEVKLLTRKPAAKKPAAKKTEEKKESE